MTAGDRVVRVLPDEPAIDREFDYLLPATLTAADRADVGWVVRVDLRGRRVRGWVTAVDVEPPPGVELAAVTKVSGAGPPPALVDLAGWAAHRWAGRRPHFLRTATPERVVLDRPPAPGPVELPAGPAAAETVEAGLRSGRAVVRVPPVADDLSAVLTVARRGRTLVLVPSVDAARHLTLGLRRAGIPAARHPDDWSAARTSPVVVGSRAAAWAPCTDLAAVVVLDEHDEAYQEESAPTWHARDVAVERARRDGAICLLVSPAPSVTAIASGWPVVRPSRSAERAGWPVVDVVDRRRDDPAMGDWCSPRLGRLLADAEGRRVVAVVNRKGRAAMAVCRQCGEVARAAAGRPLALVTDGLEDRSTGERRPLVCLECGSTAFRRLRVGTDGVRSELERMAGRPVTEITAETELDVDVGDLVVGTEAALHRVDAAAVVVFLDFDQELLAPRYRAAEEAMALLVRAARLVGGRSGGGRIVVQTRLPTHPVIDAALHADPGRLVDGELATRAALRLPPAVAMAVVSGPPAAGFVERLGPLPLGVQVRGPHEGRWQVLAPDHATLSAVLAAARRPAGRLRIEVDPLRA